MTQGLNLKIADIVFSILPTGTMKRFSVENSHSLFKTDETADVLLKAKIQALPRIQYTKDGFDTSIWAYSKFRGRHIFRFFSYVKKRTERTLILEPDFKKGEIIFPEIITPEQRRFLQNPFGYPLDQLLMIGLLHQMQGLLLHSCGFTYKNKGYLLIGSSGAGKSTLAQVIGKKNGVHVLNDDRIIVRKRQNRFYIYGTPWHGEAGFTSPEKAPLKGLFFLKKDTKNYLQNLSVSDAVSRLIKYSFPPFWDRDGMAATLKICEEIEIAIPYVEFSFTPDNSAFEFIKEKF